jgi:hypothetical protein
MSSVQLLQHLDVQLTDPRGTGSQARLQKVPDSCPLCHRSIQPVFFVGATLPSRILSQVVFRCPHTECQELFLATYRPVGPAVNPMPYQFVSMAPMKAKKATLPEAVEKLSPSFVQIYNQAVAAEAAELDQLVGIGLRKAVEFLIKDYLCSERPGKADEIKATLLGPCIDRYVSDPNVKACAKRATWLGNDETHYVRRWESQDITDLKNLVRLTVNWIDSHLLTKQYLTEMPPSGP